MVALVVMAMLVFTLDSLFSSQEPQFPVLGLVVGGAIFAIAGIGKGKWMQYGASGALLGALLGWIMPGLIVPDSETALNSSLGIFDRERVGDLSNRREIANGFLQMAVMESAEKDSFPNIPQFTLNQGVDDVVFGELMRSEADNLGIVVTDAMVSDFISRATDNRLSREAYAKIRNKLFYDGQKISDEKLYEILKLEIKAMLAYRVLAPTFSALPPAPEVYYDMFRRLNVRQRMNTTVVDVDAFLDQVGEPSDAEVTELFEKAKDKFPNEVEPGSPGFRQSPKVKLAWIELGYKQVESQVAAITDAEIEAFYNENKETLYKRPVAPEPPAQPATTPAEGTPTEETPAEGTPTTTTEGAPATPTEGTPAAPVEGAPADGTPATPAEPTPATEPPAPATEQPAPATEQPAPPAEQPAEPTPTPENPAPSESPDGSCGPVQEPVQTDENPADETPATESPAAETPETETPATETPAAETPAATDPAAPQATPAADQPPATNEPAEGTATPATQEPLVIPAQPADPATQFPEQKFEIRPLDDELKGQIRDQLLSRKVRETIDKKMNSIVIEMKRLQKQRSSLRLKLSGDSDAKLTPEQISEKTRALSPELNEKAKALAQQNGCEYVETPLLNELALSNTDNYPIAEATPPGSNPFMNNGPNVFMEAFNSRLEELYYTARRATANSFDPDGGETHYAWWVIDSSETFIPTLDQPGIKEEVVLTWKRMKARELAKKRAEELAALVKAGVEKPDDQKVPMSTSLEGQTITGKETSAKLAVRQTQQFSWLEQDIQSLINRNSEPRANLATIRFEGETDSYIRYAGNDFMRVVFDEIPNNGVGVVPDALLSQYYVVEVKDRTPDVNAGEEALQQRFLAEGKQFGFAASPVLSESQRSVARPVVVEWVKAMWKKYGIDPEASSGT
ncbi:MAG: hypothetical protein JNL58_27440 [Planctomyces sp.]|nr:hypothetical protein [Planctomyces sp.]